MSVWYRQQREGLCLPESPTPRAMRAVVGGDRLYPGYRMSICMLHCSHLLSRALPCCTEHAEAAKSTGI